ncbi:hypothetical protein [Vibrio panuliri]|uniref:Uncharacterized protein n=1 Tax=Vibrio panuliri TaxID=1381081 RepID=A0ABX3FRT7_9VIBR|nr:hypothetical protein [Vibrio panuliri]KAB1454971.1 hypothetical protein F7O85_19185 [Vibrio panuliri]OLQ95492.1 hypothetical protein BIY20_21055 [Vibrio panuliri]
MSKTSGRESYQGLIYLIQFAIIGVIFYRGQQIYNVVPDKFDNALWLGLFVFLYFICLRTATQNHAGYDATETTYYRNGSYSHQNVNLSSRWEAKSREEQQAIMAANGGLSPLVFGFYQAAVTTLYCMFIFNDFGWSMWVHILVGFVGLCFCWAMVGHFLRGIETIGRSSLAAGFILDLILVSGVTASVCSTIMFFWHHN